MKKKIAIFLWVSALILFLWPGAGEGQSNPAQPATTKGGQSGFLLPQEKTQLSYTEKKGQSLFDYYCALCHGTTGNGDGFNSYTLATPPAKLADPKVMAGLSDNQIMTVVRKGGTAMGLSPLMPAWGNLFKMPEMKSLVAYLRTLSRK